MHTNRIPPRRPLRPWQPQAEGLERRPLLAAKAGPLLVGVLGDSLSDEYATNAPVPVTGQSPLPEIATVGFDSARNWVMELAATRSTALNFGAYSVSPRAGTRAAGFAQDWAVSGASAVGTANNLAQQTNGSPGLLTQTKATTGVRPRDLGAVVLMIGTNDYNRSIDQYVASAGQSDDFAPSAGETVGAVNRRVEGAIRATVSQIHQVAPKAAVIVVTPPDLTQTAGTGGGLRFLNSVAPGLTDRYAGSLQALNADLAATAKSQHYGLVDTQTLLAPRFANPNVAGVAMNYAVAGQNWTDGYIGDDYHPGTVIQGFFAQAIVRQLNAQAGRTVVPPVTDREIVGYAQAVQSSVTLTVTPARSLSPNPGTTPLVTLTAHVAAGPGATTAPTGLVTFAAVAPAVGLTPAAFGTDLGEAPLDSTGTATLTVPATILATASYHAIYEGDITHTRVISPGDGF